MFIFYDIETTGIDIVHDQILQFGAILTDEDLVEVDRFEIRCQLLPWIVPSPDALIVTATPVGRLEDASLPDFYAMMQKIAERLAAWGPATFIGYNSMRFDEPFLQRAFWQALLPPYLTVTGGNARLDLLPLIRAAACFRPGLLNIPFGEKGAPSFRLDGLAPANGFNAHRAHDAMGDVEATLFLARKIAQGFPELWGPLSMRAPKAELTALLGSGAPVFLFRHGGTPPVTCYHRIDKGYGRGSHAVLAQLGYDWTSAKAKIDSFKPGESAALRKALHRIALNKAPLLFTLSEAEAIAGLTPEAAELAQAEFLAGDSDYCLRLTEMVAPFARPEPIAGAQVEETIFDGFASAQDEQLMAEFQLADPPEQLMIARAFSDPRFRHLAIRVLYVRAQNLLGERELEQMRLGIRRRLDGDEAGGHRWRSISDAIAELEANSERTPTVEELEIMTWLINR
ncbi:hypothetical protein F9288_15020 [Sphingomonas sp. CL5.1]|uniref:exonuclease domain-containing protein n=1 Tax=Sphingomonas sp. CL5.1 TaxID=2653203 RepID=UPI0015836533|nr:exonuclease domain-containing protein [Sphingomonas sp. CL5.1]QKS00787.1 hypothetical protein F9288_15020 [Sphingomonas sp. CL5.1]